MTHDARKPAPRATWAWQPFGPAEDSRCVTTLGNHYRGFPVIKICDDCYRDLDNGHTLVFTYKSVRYYSDGFALQETPF